MAAASSAPPGAAPAEALCDSLQRRLMRWHQLGEAAEYYDLLNRGPYKPTVIHALNRFGCAAVQWAAAAGNVETCRWLLVQGIGTLAVGSNAVCLATPRYASLRYASLRASL